MVFGTLSSKTTEVSPVIVGLTNATPAETIDWLYRTLEDGCVVYWLLGGLKNGHRRHHSPWSNGSRRDENEGQEWGEYLGIKIPFFSKFRRYTAVIITKANSMTKKRQWHKICNDATFQFYRENATSYFYIIPHPYIANNIYTRLTRNTNKTRPEYFLVAMLC